jgi:Dual specificity phosphatase, catalytic domain
MNRDRDFMEDHKLENTILPLPEAALKARLDVVRKYVARPIPIHDQGWTDPQPALVEGGCVLIGNKYHAADVENLLALRVTAVLNCASGGISRLPVDRLTDSGIRYTFTNVKRDDYDYPILHDKSGLCSQHLEVAKALYGDVRREGGKVLFFCVAGQNRSATLAIAVMMLYGHSLEDCLKSCSKLRPFVLENVGFGRKRQN